MTSTERFEKVPIDKLVPYARNARTHSAQQILELRASLREFGFVSPCVITGDMTIIAGHGRILAAKDEGFTEVPCVFAEHLTEAQRRAYTLADNRLAMNAGWDEKMLAVELSDLQSSAFDLSILGFDDTELNKLLSADGDVADDDFDVDRAAQEPPFIKPGDLVTLGRHRLLCGDATNAADMSRLMDGKQANLVLTDPPYGVNYVGKSGKIANDNLTDEQFYNFLLSAFRLMGSAMADDASIYIFYADSKGLIFRRAFSDAGMYLSGNCVWVKNTFTLGRSDYQWQHEVCLYGWKKSGKHKWRGDRKQSTIWQCDKPKKNEGHPTIKPIPLLSIPLNNSSMTNSIVLDPFSGSFSTGIACEQMGRVCYGLELDPVYASVSVKRYIEQAGSSDAVFIERDGENIPYADIMEAIM